MLYSIVSKDLFLFSLWYFSCTQIGGVGVEHMPVDKSTWHGAPPLPASSAVSFSVTAAWELTGPSSRSPGN